jgi:intracellular sulfur oxidation DsrE/DsrF family protein
MEEQKDSPSSIAPLARRSFLTGVGTGMTLLGTAAAIVVPASVEAQTAAESHFQPARHAQDDWLDQIPGQHRCVFDTTTPEGTSSAALYASNFFTANQSSYSLQNGDLAVVIVLRHNSTPFAYNDAIWAKYGAPISQQAGNFVDPRTKATPIINVYRTQLEGLTRRGVVLAVCQMATRAFAGSIARAVGGNTDAVYDELAANLLASSHLVAAGIVAVNRAQERGYTFVHAV